MNKLLAAIFLLLNMTLADAQTSDGVEVSIDGLKKSLGVNMKFRVPEGWKENQSRLPHVVKSYYNLDYALIFNIVIQEAPTFVSRNEFRNAMDEYHKQFDDQCRKDPSVLYYSELSYDVVTIDQYPFMATCVVDQRNYSDYRDSVMRYSTLYEDRFITISFINHYVDVRLFQSEIDKIIKSIMFPDQYLTY